MTDSRERRTAQTPTPLAAAWRLLGSPRFAIYLLLILAGAAVLGTVVPQYDPAQPEPSLLAYVVQPHHVYGSWWFIALLWLISINLAICSYWRGRRVWRQTRRPDVLVQRDQVAAMPDSAAWEISGPAEHVEGRAVRAVRGLGYRVRTAHSAGAIAIHGQRGTLGAWGSFVAHMSMLLIFAGAAYGHLPALGFDVVASIAVGSQYRIPKTDLSVALRRTDVIVDSQGCVSQYESDLEILRDGRRVARKTISVNHPLRYGGYTMYQMSWGTEVNPGEVPAGETGFDLVVRAADGQSYRVPVSLPLKQLGLRGKVVEIKRPPWKLFLQQFLPGALVENGLHEQVPALIQHAYLLGAAGHGSDGMDVIDLGAIRQGESTIHEGVALTLDNVRLRSGIEIRRDPGVPIVWVGCGLLVVGLFLTFYIWPRTIRVHISASDDRTSVAAGATGRGDGHAAADLQTLGQALRTAEGTSEG